MKPNASSTVQVIWDRKPTAEAFFAVVDGGKLSLTPQALQHIVEGREVVERLLADGRPIYGLNRGLGSLKDHALSREEISHFNQIVWQSHAIVGDEVPLTDLEVRALIAARVAGMARGVSGARPQLVQRLIDFLNLGLHPVVRARYLSVGESDLSPMAQIACALMGEGEIRYQGQAMPAAEALRAAGLQPILPEAKDGLALISANSYCVGVGLTALRDAINVLAAANTIGALMYDGYAASSTALLPEVFEARDFVGIRVCGQVFRKLLAGDALEREARALQDPLSYRCIVQVHGAIHDVLMQAANTHLSMLGSGNDSPLVTQDGLFSNGNFEATGLALAMDHVRLALHRLASLSTERVHKMLWGEFSGLPTSLFPQDEARNGMFLNNLSRSLSAMMAGVGSLALPSGLSTCSQITAGMDDYQSLAPTSLERLQDQLPIMKRVLAIEALNATRAIKCRGAPVSPALQEIYNLLLDKSEKLFSARARMVVADWYNDFPWSLAARLGMPEENQEWL